MKIKIKIPAEKKPWMIQLGTSNYKRPTAVSAFGLIERKLSKKLALSLKDKIEVVVDYGVEHPSEPNDWKNEGLYDNSNAALYALACFLEDYLPDNYVKEKFKKYFI